MAELTLYYKPTCPFCTKVRNFMQENNIRLPLKSILELENREELVEHGGKQQVPALDINGKIMYESDEIIKYLTENNL